MDITFHTNLDEAKTFVHNQTRWYYQVHPWTHVPAVGSYLRFALPIEPKGSYFELEVVSVSYSADGRGCAVELHIPRHEKSVDSYPNGISIAEWEKNLRKRLGKV